MTAIEQLKQEADGLSEPLAQEVLDFLLFVRERHEARTGWPPGLFERTAGAWKGGSRLNAHFKMNPNSVWNWNNVAIALSHNFTLVTHNTREFSRVVGLNLEDWET